MRAVFFLSAATGSLRSFGSVERTSNSPRLPAIQKIPHADEERFSRERLSTTTVMLRPTHRRRSATSSDGKGAKDSTGKTGPFLNPLPTIQRLACPGRKRPARLPQAGGSRWSSRTPRQRQMRSCTRRLRRIVRRSRAGENAEHSFQKRYWFVRLSGRDRDTVTSAENEMDFTACTRPVPLPADR